MGGAEPTKFVTPEAAKIDRTLPSRSIHLPHEDDEITSVEFYDREFQRKAKEFLVHVIGDRKVFKTKTVNISLGGMLLAQSLPSWVVGYCRVRVFRPNSADFVDLTCALVENQDPKQRVRLQVVEDGHSRGPQKLKTWLAA